MNNSKMWLVVKPTVGIPMFLGAVAVGSFAVVGSFAAVGSFYVVGSFSVVGSFAVVGNLVVVGYCLQMFGFFEAPWFSVLYLCLATTGTSSACASFLTLSDAKKDLNG